MVHGNRHFEINRKAIVMREKVREVAHKNALTISWLALLAVLTWAVLIGNAAWRIAHGG